MRIPEKINITEDEIRPLFQSLLDIENPGSILDITVYSYTAGYESIRFNSDNIFIQNNYNSSLKLMLKLKMNNKIEDIKFITVDGKDKADLFNKLGPIIKGLSR